MGDPESKERHFKRRNYIAKELRDQGERKGAFALRIVNPKKTEYKRKKLRINEVDNLDDE